MNGLLAPVRTFFEAERQRSQWRGLLIVVLVAAEPFVVTLLFAAVLPQGDQPVLAFATGTEAIEAPVYALASVLIRFATPILSWLAYAAVVYGVTTRFDGQGSFTRFATLFAWGFAPGLLIQVVWLGAVVASALTTPVPADPAGNAAWIQSVQSGSIQSALGSVYPLLTVVTAVLWIVATAVGRRVSSRQATVAVLPVLIFTVARYAVQYV